MSDPRNTWQLRAQREAYRNNWITVEHHDVLTPGGTEGIYGVVRFANTAIGIVTLDEAGDTTLVGQWRYTLEQYSWEIPEGGAPHGEDLLGAARRELREETGLSANTWVKLVEVDLSNSVTDERGVLFLAEDLQAGESAPEDTEDLAVRKVSLAEAVAMALRGEIRDSLSVTGLLAAERYLRVRDSSEG